MLSRALDRIEESANRFFARAWPSYVLIALLQTKIIWRIWDLRDGTYGDTASYFRTAEAWRDGFRMNIVWSPLYTSFYGSFLWVTSDPVMATTLHRVAIVMLATMGVLFVLRAVLPPPLALLGAVWWAVLPINFNTLYEVHLFALLPILAAWGLILTIDKPWARGCAIAIIAGAAVLVRNEFGLGAAGLAVLCLIYEARNRPACASPGGTAATYLAAYGLPLLAAAALCLLAYWRSTVRFPQIWSALDAKHTLNMCQVYAFGYQQRNPTWTQSPWLDCRSLAAEVFGTGLPSARQMVAANPAATIEHYLWNLSLVGNGLQVLLFNAMSGRVNPDYAPVRSAWYPLALSIATCAAIVAGVWSARRSWWDGARDWLFERRRALIAFLPFLLMAIPVVLTQRPRPSYFPYVSIIAITVTLGALGLASHRFTAARKLAAAFAVATAACVLVLVPPYYVRNPSARPLAAKIEHIRPHHALVQTTRGRVVIGEFASEVASYLSIRRQIADPMGREPELRDNAILAQWDRARPLEQFLADNAVTVFYVDPAILGELRRAPQAQRLLDQPATVGWRVLGAEARGSGSWMMLARDPP